MAINSDMVQDREIKDISLLKCDDGNIVGIVLHYDDSRFMIKAIGMGDSRTHFSDIPVNSKWIGRTIRSINHHYNGEFTMIGSWDGNDERVTNYVVEILFNDGAYLHFKLYNSSDGSNDGTIEVSRVK